MNPAEERKLALRIVKEAGAEKTAAAIKDPNACYDTILQTAIDEIGMKSLTSIILKSEPSWAYKMLGLFPDIGAEKEALINKALEDKRFDSYVDTPSSSTPGNLPGRSFEGLAPENIEASVPIVNFRFTSGYQYIANPGLKWISDNREHERFPMDNSLRMYESLTKEDTALLEPGTIGRGKIKPGDQIWPIIRIPTDASYQNYRVIESETRFIWHPTKGEMVNGRPASDAYFDVTSLPDVRLVFSRFVG